MIQGAGQLVVAAHQGIGVDMDIHILELGQRGIGHGMQGFTGGIRYQVNVKFMIHRTVPKIPLCWV